MELISREMAIDHMRVLGGEDRERLIGILNNKNILPTIESKPKGKWIEKEYDEWYCSNCERKALYYFGKPFGEYKVFQVKSEYCPHCGAKMEEEK